MEWLLLDLRFLYSYLGYRTDLQDCHFCSSFFYTAPSKALAINKATGPQEPADPEKAVREGFLEEATLSTRKPVPGHGNSLTKGMTFPEKC